jgi:two-component system sensor histidine kinase TctE
MKKIKLEPHSDTLRKQLLKWVLIPMAILLLLNIILAYKFGHDSADRRHDRFLSDTSKIMLDQLRTNAGNVEFNLHSGALNMLTEDKKDQVYFSLRGWQQEYQFGSADLPMPAGKLGENPIYYMANYHGQQLRMMAAILPESDVVTGRVVVVLGKTLVLHHERAQEWMWRVLPSQLSLIVFAGVMVWWGVGRGLRPLIKLREEVTSRSSQDLSPLRENEVVAEIRPLIHGFNELMGRLDDSFEIQRRFVADAAHQLRTPLTGLKMQAELALSLDDVEEIRYSMQQICKAADHAAHLANQLLVLARSEPNAQNQTSMTVLDMAALARSSAAYWAPIALNKGIDLGFESIDDDYHISGFSLLLSEMLNNLIDNAIRYTPKGGQVTVRVARNEASIIIDVVDNGLGIAEHERERVFERFYRVLGTDQDGCGLGLAIVREIAHRHNAEIRLLQADERCGTIARVSFRLK